MVSFLFAEANLPFLVALGLMVAIALMEGVAALLGGGLSSLIDSLLPDSLSGVDVDLDVDVDADLDVDVDVDVAALDGASGGLALSGLLGWLSFGRVPALILLIIFLASFGLVGLFTQKLAVSVLDTTLPGWLATAPALVLAFLAMRYLGRGFARLIPKEETEAVSRASFIGRVAVITLGEARLGRPAQARLRDEHGQSHYVMVEPDEDHEVFATGDEVILVREARGRFHVIRNPSLTLSTGSS